MSTSFIPIQKADILWRQGLPFSREYNDIYFSTDNALDETKHVFIAGNNLTYRWQNLPQQSCSSFFIAETGFGCGVNFLVAWSEWLNHAPNNATLHYFSCEKHPLSKQDLTQCLTLWPALDVEAKALIRAYPVLTPGFHHLSFLNGRIKLTLMLGDACACYEQLLSTGDAFFESQVRPNKVDAWFLDGFSPAKNPSMWQGELFKIMGLLSCKETTLATFTAAGEVKRGLQAAGYNIEIRPGYGQKRDMICGQFNGAATSLHKRHTPWAFNKPKIVQNKQATVIGAGLAGCFIAHSLANRGWKITLIDKHDAPGQGASGNRQAVLFPVISPYRAPLTEWMLSAFQYGARVYKEILKHYPIGELKGLLKLAYNSREKHRQNALAEWLRHYPELGELMDNDKSSHVAGVAVLSDGLFVPQSGWIDSQQLCQLLIDHDNICWQGGGVAESINYQSGQWVVNDYAAETLIIANGYQASQFEQTKYLPLQSTRGQMTLIAQTHQSKSLLIPLCAQGHVLPSHGGFHHIGATYHPNDDDPSARDGDDSVNLSRLKTITRDLPWSFNPVSQWAGIRASTPDHLPMVGSVIQASSFKAAYASLAKDSKRWIPALAASYPGLFVMAGFGSKGLTSAPLCAEWLAGHINQEPSILPRNMIQAISPSRFLKRAIASKLS